MSKPTEKEKNVSVANTLIAQMGLCNTNLSKCRFPTIFASNYIPADIGIKMALFVKNLTIRLQLANYILIR